MSLTEYLVNLDSSERFIEFVETTQDVGHLPALQRVYGIRGLDELESKWLRYAASQSVTPGGVPVSRRVDR
jgi:hypothetical protein